MAKRPKRPVKVRDDAYLIDPELAAELGKQLKDRLPDKGTLERENNIIENSKDLKDNKDERTEQLEFIAGLPKLGGPKLKKGRKEIAARGDGDKDHFIKPGQRPDLSGGALTGEADKGKPARKPRKR